MPSLVDTEMPASGSILRLTAFKTTFALAMNSDDDDHVMMWWWWWWWWSCDYIYYWKYRHGCIWARTKRGLVLISWFHSSATLSSDSTLNTKLNLSNRTIVSWCLSSTFDYKIIDQLEFFKKLWKNDRNREKNKWKSQEWKTLKVKKGRKVENCEVERKWEKKERSREERVTEPPAGWHKAL